MTSLVLVIVLAVEVFGRPTPPSQAPIPPLAQVPAPVAAPEEIPVRRFPNQVKPAGDADVDVAPVLRVDAREFISGGAKNGVPGARDATEGIEFPRLLASVELGRSSRSPGALAFEQVGDEIRVQDRGGASGPLIGVIRIEPQRIRWQWSDEPDVVPADRVEAVAAALRGIRLEALLIEGQLCEVLFESSAVPEAPLPEAPDVAEEFIDALPLLKLDPFLPEVRGGDIESSEDVLYTPTVPVSELRLLVPSQDAAPDGVLPKQADKTTVEFWSEGAEGKPGHRVAELSVSSKGKLTWSWERLDQASNAAAIEAIQRMAQEMVVELSGSRGAKWRLRVAESLSSAPQLVQSGALSGGVAPSGAAPAGAAGPTPMQLELIKAIRAVEEEYRQQATAFSKARYRERQQAANARARQADEARKGRNRRQRHEEKHGWWDRDGRWHAPDGHMSRAEDDRQDGVIKGAPNAPRGAFGDGVDNWQNKMRAEVAAELAQDKDRYRTPIPLPSPLDQPEFADRAAKFAKERRGAIPDGRIVEMLDKLAKRIRDAQAAQPTVP